MKTRWAINKNTRNSGFTIVELLIVVVVIAILAAITIVSYNGINKRAEISAIKHELKSSSTKLQSAKVLSNDIYSAAVISPFLFQQSSSSTTRYKYGTSTGFCLEAVSKNNTTYRLNSTAGGTSTIEEGACPATSSIVEPRCLGSSAYLATTQNNYTSEVLSITTTTPYGPTSGTINPGQNLYQLFSASGSSIGRGLATFTLSGMGASTFSETRFHAYEPINC